MTSPELESNSTLRVPTAPGGAETASPAADRRPWWRRALIPAGVVTGALAAYGGPPLGYWVATRPNENWGQFFPVVATPYGTITAGLAAITAAGIALHNGRQQRRSENRRATAQLDQQRVELAATERRSAAELAHAQQVSRDTAAAATVRDLHTRFTDAAKQLADENETIQLAGAYALGSVAEDWLADGNRQEAQVCVDVLCAYLRTHHLRSVPPEESYDYTTPPPDLTVRSAIVNLIARHCQTPPSSPRATLTTPGPWSDMDIDVRGSHLWEADFSWTHFTGTQVRFDDVRFGGFSRFDRASFVAKNPAQFAGARFAAGVTFRHAHFDRGTNFSNVRFDGQTTFADAELRGAASFRSAEFTDADFCRTRFHDEANFSRAVFKDSVDFSRGHDYDLDTAAGPGASFMGKAVFINVTFAAFTTFAGARFTKSATFMAARFLEGSETDLRETDFSALEPDAYIDFRRPRVWDSPPSVAWEAGPSAAPEYVRPRTWPPPTAGSAMTPPIPIED